MHQTTEISEFQIIRVKDIQNLMNVSKRTAERYIKDIKETYKIRFVLYKHYKKYFQI